MMDYNRNVGVSAEECYLQHEEMIKQLAYKSKGALKDTSSLNLEDLYQIATIGFLNAYKDYTTKYKTSFTTYAHNRIKWELYNTLKKRYSIHFPSSFSVIWNIMNKYYLHSDNLDEINKRKPKNIAVSTVKVAVSWAGKTTPTSLDKTMSSETRGDKDQDLYDVVAGGYLDETKAVVMDFVGTLKDKQATIVLLLMNGLTQSEISKQVSLNQSQVSRIIKAVQKQWLEYAEEVEA